MDKIPWHNIATVKGAAKELGVTRARIHQLMQAGKLDGHQVDGLWLVDRRTVDERKKGKYSAG